jgi:hypothetical protein
MTLGKRSRARIVRSGRYGTIVRHSRTLPGWVVRVKGRKFDLTYLYDELEEA